MLVTGTRTGVSTATDVLYSRQHLATSPAPGRRRLDRRRPGRTALLDPGSGGPENASPTATHVHDWNLLHLARMITDAGGIPSTGTSGRVGRGCSFDPNPDAPGNPRTKARTMAFVQIIDFRTSRHRRARRVGDAWRGRTEGRRTVRRGSWPGRNDPPATSSGLLRSTSRPWRTPSSPRLRPRPKRRRPAERRHLRGLDVIEER